MAMDVYTAIVGKRDTRTYSAEPISEDQLQKILQAGRMAGSARAAEPVRIVVIREESQRAKLAECGNSTEHLRAAPVVIAIVLVPEFGVVGAPFTLFRGPFDARWTKHDARRMGDGHRQLPCLDARCGGGSAGARTA